MELDGHLFGDGQPCFGCGPDHPIGFRLRFAVEGLEVVTRFTPGPRYQGPPGIFHGGLVMTLGDELAAWTLVGLEQRFGFTTRADMRLAKATRIGVEIEGRGRILKSGRRLVDLGVVLRQEGVTTAEGTFRFVVLDEAGAERLLGQPLTEAWKRMTR